MLDSYGLTPKSPQTNFEMMDEEVRSSSAAALPWQAPRFSPMLTCAPPAQFTKCVVYLDPEEFKTTWCGMPPPAARCCCGAPHHAAKQARQQGGLSDAHGYGDGRRTDRAGARYLALAF